MTKRYEELLEAAFAYQKTKLWKKLHDTELFAVKVSPRKILLVSIMGRIGEHRAVAAYDVKKGLDFYMRVVKNEEAEFLETHPMQMHEFFTSQNCLQAVFDHPLDMESEDVRRVFEYMDDNDMEDDPDSYPHFLKFEEAHAPWNRLSAREQEDLLQVLKASTALGLFLKRKKPEKYGFQMVDARGMEIPLMECLDGTYQITGRYTLPEEGKKEYPTPKSINDLLVHSLKKIRAKGVWDAEVVMCPEPFQDHPNQVPYMGHMLFFVSEEDGGLLNPGLKNNYREAPEEMVNDLMDALKTVRKRPAKILARDERTYVLLTELAEKLNCSLEIRQDLPILDEAEEFFVEQFAGMDMDDEEEELFDFLDDLLDLSDEEAAMLPDELRDELGKLLSTGVLPEELEELLRDKFFRG